MQTPDTLAGHTTEAIMHIFWDEQVVKLTTEQYNRVYSHVLNTLNNVFTTKQKKG